MRLIGLPLLSLLLIMIFEPCAAQITPTPFWSVTNDNDAHSNTWHPENFWMQQHFAGTNPTEQEFPHLSSQSGQLRSVEVRPKELSSSSETSINQTNFRESGGKTDKTQTLDLPVQRAAANRPNVLVRRLHRKRPTSSRNLNSATKAVTNFTRDTMSPYFTCSVCGKILISRSGFYGHFELYHSDGAKYGCDVCQRKFVNRSNLKEHYRIHTNEKPFECGICNKKFNNGGSYWRHKLTHGDKKPYVCDRCNKGHLTKWDLTKHSRRCTRGWNNISTTKSATI